MSHVDRRFEKHEHDSDMSIEDSVTCSCSLLQHEACPAVDQTMSCLHCRSIIQGSELKM